MKALNDNSKTMYQEHLAPLASLNNAYALFYFIRSDMFKYVAVPNDRVRLAAELNDLFGKYDKDIDSYRQKKLTDDENKNLQILIDQMKLFKEDVTGLMALVDEGHHGEKISAMLSHTARIALTRQAVDAAFTELIALNDNLAERSFRGFEQSIFTDDYIEPDRRRRGHRSVAAFGIFSLPRHYGSA
jgi:hypothetical protein